MDNALATSSEQIHHRVSIAGCISDAITKQSLKGIAVEVEGQNLYTLTREDGSFYFIDLPDGLYNLKVSPSYSNGCYGSANVTDVEVQNVTNSKPVFDLKANVELQPTQLVGKVQRRDNKQPVAKATVRLCGTNIQTSTDKEGRYIFIGLQQGNLTIQASAKGFLSEKQKVSLKVGQKMTADDFNLTLS
jgi:Carboxypeptidase regulatory-like domain